MACRFIDTGHVWVLVLEENHSKLLWDGDDETVCAVFDSHFANGDLDLSLLELTDILSHIPVIDKLVKMGVQLIQASGRVKVCNQCSLKVVPLRGHVPIASFDGLVPSMSTILKQWRNDKGPLVSQELSLLKAVLSSTKPGFNILIRSASKWQQVYPWDREMHSRGGCQGQGCVDSKVGPCKSVLQGILSKKEKSKKVTEKSVDFWSTEVLFF